MKKIAVALGIISCLSMEMQAAKLWFKNERKIDYKIEIQYLTPRRKKASMGATLLAGQELSGGSEFNINGCVQLIILRSGKDFSYTQEITAQELKEMGKHGDHCNGFFFIIINNKITPGYDINAPESGAWSLQD